MKIWTSPYDQNQLIKWTAHRDFHNDSLMNVCYNIGRLEVGMKKTIIPALIAIALIFIIGGVAFGAKIIEKYSYSKEHYDMTVYFENKSESDIAIILQDDFMSERAYLYDGTYYVDMDFLRNYLNDRFYYDEVDELLIYALPTDIIRVAINGTEYEASFGEGGSLGYVAARKEGDKLLVALDYIKRFTNFSYEPFSDPGRIQMYTRWPEIQVATVRKNTAVRHRGGIKSEILKDLSAGDKVTVIEAMDEWSKVKTDDGIIGFVENKRLGDPIAELPIPVTDYEEPEYTNLCRDYKINMGWHVVAGVGGNDTLDSVVSGTTGLNVISPTWFNLKDSEGNYDSFATANYVQRAHALGLEVWPTFNNTENGGDLDLDALLSSYSKRTSLISRLMSDILNAGIDGINIDIEMLPTSAGRDFSEFIRELSVSCRRNGVVLSIDNYVPIGNTNYYDRKTQGEVADYVVIMGYDEHYAGSAEAGSVASIGYVETGIKNTLEEVPAFKVINGIPFYTRIWETNGANVKSTAVDMPTAKNWIANHNITLAWDDNTCQNYGEYQGVDGTLHQIWMEDAESIRVKLNVMDAYGIAGVAQWRLGYETSDIWVEIGDYLNR